MGIEMLRAALDKSRINSLITQYWRVSVVDVTTSTQSDLAALVRSGKAKPGDVIAANFQSAGRGRLSRTFEAPKNSALLFSFYIQPKRKKEDWGWIALIAGISVAQALGKVKATVKWPNDILVNEKKISGLIAEIVGDGVVIGIGINVGMSLEELPVLTATSLAIEGVSDIDRNEILAKVLSQFESNFITWDEGDDSVAQIYTSLSSTLGTKVQIHYPNDEIEKGLAVAISPRGELVLDSGRRVQAGDVVHLR
ncbi:MAG: biotin--[acetyl-CoA-carboxylase] ligase [Actinomycetales bacterium]|nr:biotin--[acetyl-CoA-carboxylase] ligase [Actinomycetales bacterium]